LTDWSLKNAPLELTVAVAVTPPVPVTGVFTVSAMDVVWVIVPLVPVMVTVAAPRVAVLDAVNVRALVPVVEAGLNAVVTPAGNPLALNATLPVKPPLGVMVIVLPDVAPRLMDTVAGLAAMVKLGVAGVFTVRLTVAECDTAPLVPVIVMVAVSVTAVVDAVKVRTELAPVVVVVAGLKLAVTPEGRPAAVKVTAPANPPVRVIVMVLVPLAPRLMASEEGLADSAKLGGGGAAFKSP